MNRNLTKNIFSQDFQCAFVIGLNLNKSERYCFLLAILLFLGCLITCSFKNIFQRICWKLSYSLPLRDIAHDKLFYPLMRRKSHYKLRVNSSKKYSKDFSVWLKSLLNVVTSKYQWASLKTTVLPLIRSTKTPRALV